jgi:uncharacterized membrane protein
MTNPDSPILKQRITSIDIVRGAIMLIMAIDHARDFFYYTGPGHLPTDMSTTTPILFFTRFITHFCAPIFVFLSGVSAYIAGTRRTKGELTSFLVKRGLWLVLMEVTIITFFITADPFYHVLILQVLWAIGLSMVILGLLSRLPLVYIGIIGAIIFFGHDILDGRALATNGTAAFDIESVFLTAFGTFIPLGKTHGILDLYAVLPWTGIMLLGYVFGSMYRPQYDGTKRRRILRYTGIGALCLFIALRLVNGYGDPAPWSQQKNMVYTFMSFLNVSKYPPSLLYSLMTLSIALLALAYTERINTRFTKFLTVYGNVPFFYYVPQWILLRVINIIMFFASGFTTSQIYVPGSFLFEPPGYGFPLWTVYLVWLTVIALLYLPCRWYGNYKRTHKQWWLSYL